MLRCPADVARNRHQRVARALGGRSGTRRADAALVVRIEGTRALVQIGGMTSSNKAV